jgi:hypothetical protein
MLVSALDTKKKYSLNLLSCVIMYYLWEELMLQQKYYFLIACMAVVYKALVS